MGNLEVVLKVLLFEVEEFLLVVTSLLLVDVTDFLHHRLATLQVADLLLIVLHKAEALIVLQHAVRASHTERILFDLCFKVFELLIELFEPLIDLRSLAEAKRPINEASIDGDINLTANFI